MKTKLIECPDCGNQVSRKADACPKCGRRINPRQSALGIVAAAIIGGWIFWALVMLEIL